MRVTTLGDLLLDVVVRLDEPLAMGSDRTAVTRVGAGGQAANVAAWAAELGAEARCIATGGLAQRIANETSTIERVEPFLTLEGLRLLFEKNHSEGPRKER